MRQRVEYPDDFFADTRMSFGDHIEELRTRMLNALKALMFCMCIGFVLDGIGTQLDLPWFGLGRPVLAMIQQPVEDAMQNFYNERIWDESEKLRPVPTTWEERREREQERKKFLSSRLNLQNDKSVEAAKEVNNFSPLVIRIPREELLKKRDQKSDSDTIDITVQIPPLDLAILLTQATNKIGKSHALATMSAQEAFLVYVKVTLLCGVILASPIIFWQFWAFVGAGLYPHEREYVNKFLPFSLGLFIGGVILCQVWVIPGTVKGLLAFNSWLGLDPDLRLSEWLNLALLLPLVFGLSFQTPLVMLALNQIGLLSVEDYLAKWRHAVMLLTVFAVVVSPSPDVVTMLYLLIPMIALYFLGIYLCKLFPQPDWLSPEPGSEESREVAV
ncbi:twin-arginine translocase subunit TatC [Telmatocola sphagniphila]|uniref:Sec-independent protein translocase protein TatC n=1 Tax=Telmatocola sphagniphila TaxID=1123043 RepID=A0A8E6BAF2_9BACT|nr:twin-arginine translocase subunit TatC [Telmatocola sphagniphila]QVL34738.1 twin-arginine translocase subunit TatC [Telmatocola sphagniphila]